MKIMITIMQYSKNTGIGPFFYVLAKSGQF